MINIAYFFSHGRLEPNLNLLFCLSSNHPRRRPPCLYMGEECGLAIFLTNDIIYSIIEKVKQTLSLKVKLVLDEEKRRNCWLYAKITKTL